ncbi:Chromosome initiation inhibitor [hydrothermal vent metagenome]|uniref:Chromosome initiation inhibitor n=1 Tax=hydrothermal vent metagenome TaxID=652676 RepID=A0A1W1BZ59_9ZZZZ
MLKDFVKMETFLTVARERSFSKASAKLGISQPAVTQQIKYIENYLEAKIIDRKKNGIRLTPEGEELYKVVAQLEKSILVLEKDVLKIIKKEMTFRLAASYTIGSYVIPGECLNSISESIGNDVVLNIDLTDKIIRGLKERRFDVGLIESPIFDDSLIYREWFDDELVIFSNTPLPKTVNTEELYEYKWVCREEGSHTRQLIGEVFEELGVSCKSFNVLSEVSNTTAALQSVRRSKVDPSEPTVSVISKHAIAEEVARGELFESRIYGFTMSRKFYIVYSKENKNNMFIDNVVNYIISGKC